MRGGVLPTVHHSLSVCLALGGVVLLHPAQNPHHVLCGQLVCVRAVADLSSAPGSIAAPRGVYVGFRV